MDWDFNLNTFWQLNIASVSVGGESFFFFFSLEKKNSCLFLDFLPYSWTLEVKDIFNSLLPAAFPGGILSDTQEGPRRRTFFHYEPRLQQEKRWAEIANTHLANGACFGLSHRLQESLRVLREEKLSVTVAIRPFYEGILSLKPLFVGPGQEFSAP